MRHVFWLIPGKLAGRPGPNREPWDERDLKELGIDTVISLNSGEDVNRDELAALGLTYRCFPLPPNEPPLPGDEEICRGGLPPAYDFVVDQIAQGRKVLVHCSAGKDRTGLFMSYFLMRQDHLDMEAAIAQVRRVRPRAISAVGWDVLARNVLGR